MAQALSIAWGRRDVRSEGRQELRSEMGAPGSDLDESWHCAGAILFRTHPSLVLHGYYAGAGAEGSSLVLRRYCAGAALILRWYFTGTAMLPHWECTSCALVSELVMRKRFTDTRQALHWCVTGTALMLR